MPNASRSWSQRRTTPSKSASSTGIPMTDLRPSIVKSAAALALAACLLALAACRTAPEFPNAPPEVVEDCRRQVLVFMEQDPGISGTEPLSQETTDRDDDVIEDARAARADAEERDLSRWPEEILLYRCLAGRGVELSPDQARALAEWEAGLEDE